MIMLVYLLLLYSSITLFLNFFYFSKRGKDYTPGKFEKISVLIPVRNEEKELRMCLDSLLNQSYPFMEIIAMDDNSDDTSWQILREYAAKYGDTFRVLKSKPLPDGWTGKNWVCFQLSQIAKGDWLLFTDADTIHRRDSILRAYTESRVRNASLISYLPDLITVSLAEKIILPVIYFSFYLLFPLFVMKKIKNNNAAIAIGTFIFIKREIYIKIGGHRAVKNEIVDDISLARLVKKCGENFDLISGIDLFYTRFYHNLREIWKGFSKNAYGAFGYSILPYLATLAFSYFIFLNPFIKLALYKSFNIHNPYFNQVFIILALRVIVALKTKHNILSILFHPIMIVFSLLFSLNSLWKALSGNPIIWKGRAYKATK